MAARKTAGRSGERKTGRGPQRPASGKRPAPQKRAAPRKAAFRLPPHVRPTDVDVHVEVDPGAGPGFSGEVRHTLRLEQTARSIELHATDLRVSKPRIRVGGRGAERSGKIVTHEDRETVRVVLDSPIPPGEVTLELAFSGRLRGDLRGLYAARSGERAYAFTQLEAADARRFFPCFDEPAFKARFQLSVTTSSSNQVLSNQPIERVEPLEDGRKRVDFSRTPLLSTYLLALGVGELESSEAVKCGKTDIRVWHVPGKGHLTGFALEAARETLARLEKYFQLAYPYDKLDLVAVPDFEAGAMENAGAVFFRETLLLLDPETVTLQERKRAAEVICHELAHMWFGDLVTMAWWDDLWLNEAFATWMAFHIVDAWKPEWKMWHDFQHYRSAALGLDALTHTHPIYTQVRTPSEATENFDLITYEKGASVVRMIERFLGPSAFRDGVRAYIRRHRESNAKAEDLWNALSQASRQDVAPVVRPWIEQEGFPLLRIQRGVEDGEPVLVFRQERFMASPKARPRSAADPSPRWPIPWVGRLGRSKTQRALLTERREVVALEDGDPSFVYANADEGGFFRPLHPDTELEELVRNRAALRPVERMGLVGHQWAAVRAGHAALPGFLDLALALGEEEDPDVLLALGSPLSFVVDRLGAGLETDEAESLRERIGGAFTPAFDALGWDAEPEEPEAVRMRRAALLALVGNAAELPAVLGTARERCDRYLDDRTSLEPNLADSVVGLGARSADAALFERLQSAAAEARTPQDRRRMQMALAEPRDPALVDRTLDLLLGETIGTQDVALLLVRLLGNPAAREKTWTFIKRRWSTLQKRLPPMLVTRPIEALPALGTRVHRQDVAVFFREHPIATGERTVRQALERFDHDLELRTRALPELRAWLGEGD